MLGIAVALMGGQITVTDLPDVTAQLERNVKLNRVEGTCQVAPLDWCGTLVRGVVIKDSLSRLRNPTAGHLLHRL